MKNEKRGKEGREKRKAYTSENITRYIFLNQNVSLDSVHKNPKAPH